MASFCCYDSSYVIAILIMTNFPLYLIQLWWQFFPNACLWRRSLCSNLAGIDSEKLYRATFICQYGLFCCMALVSFRLFCKNLGNLQEFFGQMDYRPPLAKNCPYAYDLSCAAHFQTGKKEVLLLSALVAVVTLRVNCWTERGMT